MARGENSASQGVANQTTGPMATDGPYGIVTLFYSSPLLTSEAAAESAAAAMLARSLLPSRSISVEIVPDPRIDVDDAIEVWRDGTRWWGIVTAYDLPLTRDGSMRVDLGIGQ